MVGRDKSHLSSWIMLFCMVLFSAVATAEITVSIDRESAHLNESLQIYFVADGSVDGDPDFSPLEPYFSILNTSQSSNISIVNGNYQRSIKWTLQLLPKQAGRIAIPAIHFGNDRSQPFDLQVKPARQATKPGADGLIFELETDQTMRYVQSQVVLTLRLLSDTSIAGYQFGNMDFNNMDVIVEPLGDITQHQTRINDRAYLVLEKKYALFPQQSGELTIGPIVAEVKLGSRSQSLFDPFQNNGQIVRLQSNQLNIEIGPRVEEFKAQHWLPSNGIQLSEDWQGDLEQLSAGVPITRTVTLTAEGLTAAQLPDLGQADVPGIKQYPDTPTLKNQLSSAGIVGQRQQKIALIATGAGSYKLPEITVPWWNLETDQLEIARIAPRIINVRAGAVAGSNSQTATASQSSAGESVSGPRLEPNYFWIWLSAFLAAGWLLSLLVWWIRSRNLLQSRSESKPAAVSLSRASRKLRQACVGNNPGQARDALLPWANALISGREFVNLNQLVQYFDQPLKQIIDDLNQGLYSQSLQEWEGATLWSCCEQLATEYGNAEANSASAQLLSLNP